MEKDQQVPKGLLSSREAANYLAISTPCLRQKAHSGEIPYIRSNDGLRYKMLFEAGAIKKWIDEHRISIN